jgi:hypothetical protein
MWVDIAFDMGINFGDIFRRLNKVNPRFYQNYYRGEDRKRYYSHHKHGKIPILKGERYKIEYSMACEDRNIIGTCQQMITERLTGILTIQLTANEGLGDAERYGKHHPSMAKQTNQHS